MNIVMNGLSTVEHEAMRKALCLYEGGNREGVLDLFQREEPPLYLTMEQAGVLYAAWLRYGYVLSRLNETNTDPTKEWDIIVDTAIYKSVNAARFSEFHEAVLGSLSG